MWIIIVIDIHIPIHIRIGGTVKAIQMTLDEDLVKAVDRAARRLGTTRSAFTRDALREALRRLAVAGMERRHRRGYEVRPVEKREFSVWEREQEWGEG